MSLLSVLLEGAATPGGGYQGIVMMVLIIAVFYFFMIRPQAKRQKEIVKAREAMKVGDKVVTSGGIHGKIKEIQDGTMLVEIAPSVHIKVDKAAVFASAADSLAK
ncbi:MAG: preprotein translocase subunit YajC [Bacteroidales bacterium]